METDKGLVQYYTRKTLKKVFSILDMKDSKPPRKKDATYIVFPIPNEYSCIRFTVHHAKMPNGETIYKAEFIKRVTVG